MLSKSRSSRLEFEHQHCDLSLEAVILVQTGILDSKAGIRGLRLGLES